MNLKLIQHIIISKLAFLTLLKVGEISTKFNKYFFITFFYEKLTKIFTKP